MRICGDCERCLGDGQHARGEADRVVLCRERALRDRVGSNIAARARGGRDRARKHRCRRLAAYEPAGLIGQRRVGRAIHAAFAVGCNHERGFIDRQAIGLLGDKAIRVLRVNGDAGRRAHAGGRAAEHTGGAERKAGRQAARNKRIVRRRRRVWCCQALAVRSFVQACGQGGWQQAGCLAVGITAPTHQAVIALHAACVIQPGADLHERPGGHRKLAAAAIAPACHAVVTLHAACVIQPGADLHERPTRWRCLTKRIEAPAGQAAVGLHATREGTTRTDLRERPGGRRGFAVGSVAPARNAAIAFDAACKRLARADLRECPAWRITLHVVVAAPACHVAIALHAACVFIACTDLAECPGWWR